VMKGVRQAMGWGEWRVREVHITVTYEEAIHVQGLHYHDRRALTQRIREKYEHAVREEEEAEEASGRMGRGSDGRWRRG